MANPTDMYGNLATSQQIDPVQLQRLQEMLSNPNGRRLPENFGGGTNVGNWVNNRMTQSFGGNSPRMSIPQEPQSMEPRFRQMNKLSGMNPDEMSMRQQNRLGFLKRRFGRMG